VDTTRRKQSRNYFGREKKQVMMYPRTAMVNKEEVLVSDTDMVSHREHLAKYRFGVYAGEIRAETESCNLLIALDSVSNQPVKLIIDSPGGELDAAFMLYDTIRMMKSPVYTMGRICCSAAVILLAAGKKRYLLPHSKVMIHLPSAHLQGDSEELRIQQEQIDLYKHQLVDILLESGVKKNKKKILADMDREFWLNPTEAIEYGLADEVMTKETMKEWFKET
jgi:ATP-dependent Clp protease protease subunit